MPVLPRRSVSLFDCVNDVHSCRASSHRRSGSSDRWSGASPCLQRRHCTDHVCSVVGWVDQARPDRAGALSSRRRCRRFHVVEPVVQLVGHAAGCRDHRQVPGDRHLWRGDSADPERIWRLGRSCHHAQNFWLRRHRHTDRRSVSNRLRPEDRPVQRPRLDSR